MRGIEHMNRVSLLETQAGFYPADPKQALLRSAESHPPCCPEGKRFALLEASTGREVFAGTVERWGEKWGSYWWRLDFTDVEQEGRYRLSVPELGLDSSEFEISRTALTHSEHVDLTMVALRQLEQRQLPGVPGWRDCGTEIRELSSHIVTVHGLIDYWDNRELRDRLGPQDRQLLLNYIAEGADYIVLSQESSANPLTDGRFNHDAGRQTGYGTSDYHNWHGTAYAITALARACRTMRECDPGNLIDGTDESILTERSERYLQCAKRAYKNAMARPYNLDSDFYGRSDADGQTDGPDETEYVHELARTVYNKPDDWTIPYSLQTKDKLTFLWGVALLYRLSGESEYLETAIEYARAASERQFVDHTRPIDGLYGNFYAFEQDDETFCLEWNQNHRFHMGNIEPTNVQGFIELLKLQPDHEEAASWHNVVRTYAYGYAAVSEELSPLGIYPLTLYADPEYGGAKFFQSTNHGATALYGQIAKNLLDIGEYLNDRTFARLASRNLQFVAGLNPGFPDAYEEKSWQAISLIKGYGVRSFAGAGSQIAPPDGSGMNGFSADVQFQPQRISVTRDAPRGILFADGERQFNEDYLPHSHGYVSGAARAERPFRLNIETRYLGQPVDAQIVIALQSAEELICHTGEEGRLALDELPLQREATVTASYRGLSVARTLETLAGATWNWDIHFDSCIEAGIEAPDRIEAEPGTEGKLLVHLQNRGGEIADVKVRLSADGVTISADSIEQSCTLQPGEKTVISAIFHTGGRTKPYTLMGRIQSGNHRSTVIKDGKLIVGGGGAAIEGGLTSKRL